MFVLLFAANEKSSPVATDLRTIIVILRIITDLERVELYKRLKVSGQNINQIPYLDEEELDQLVEFLKSLSFID